MMSEPGQRGRNKTEQQKARGAREGVVRGRGGGDDRGTQGGGAVGIAYSNYSRLLELFLMLCSASLAHSVCTVT